MPTPIQPNEHPEYARPYVERAPSTDVIAALADQGTSLCRAWRTLPAGFRYEPGKWSVEEVVGHVVDIERAFSYRAMCFARGVEDELAPVDQDIMVPRSKADARGLESLITEFDHLRQSNIALFGAMDEADLMARGRASGFDYTVRALVAMIFGHADHHAEVLIERYSGAV